MATLPPCPLEGLLDELMRYPVWGKRPEWYDTTPACFVSSVFNGEQYVQGVVVVVVSVG